MNWDISIGHGRQVMGRLLQWAGQRWTSRQWVLDGEALEYAGRLQMRYGALKHQAQWGDTGMPARAAIAVGGEVSKPSSLRKSQLA